MKAKVWIEAARLRTLPVSCAGVVTACALAQLSHSLRPLPAVLCLSFAILAQIASNFANEYFDFRAGLDRPGREGPRRGVTEGDITPRAMLAATFITLGVACAIGCSLIIWGGWLLLPVGIFTALGALAYSAGPYPLSRHALGEVAVFIFFGIIPVNFTYYILVGQFDLTVLMFSAAVGLMGANILIVNNYRDAADDLTVGKHTLATRFGRPRVASLYLFNGYIAVALMLPLLMLMPLWVLAAPALYLAVHTALWLAMQRRRGAALNPLLGVTAINMLAFSIILLVEFSLVNYCPAPWTLA